MDKKSIKYKIVYINYKSHPHKVSPPLFLSIFHVIFFMAYRKTFLHIVFIIVVSPIQLNSFSIFYTTFLYLKKNIFTQLTFKIKKKIYCYSMWNEYDGRDNFALSKPFCQSKTPNDKRKSRKKYISLTINWTSCAILQPKAACGTILPYDGKITLKCSRMAKTFSIASEILLLLDPPTPLYLYTWKCILSRHYINFFVTSMLSPISIFLWQNPNQFTRCIP